MYTSACKAIPKIALQSICSILDAFSDLSLRFCLSVCRLEIMQSLKTEVVATFCVGDYPSVGPTIGNLVLCPSAANALFQPTRRN